eukprot:2222754-Rhodomonas_salina.2
MHEKANGRLTTPKNTRHTRSPTPSVPSVLLIAASAWYRSDASPLWATPKNPSIASIAAEESPPARFRNPWANSSPKPVSGFSHST